MFFRSLVPAVIGALLALIPSTGVQAVTDPAAPPTIVDLCADPTPGHASCFAQQYIGASPMMRRYASRYASFGHDRPRRLRTERPPVRVRAALEQRRHRTDRVGH